MAGDQADNITEGTLHEKMTAIADAIRGRTGGTDTLNLDQMAAAIAGLETGGGGGTDLSYAGENREVHGAVITVGANTVANITTMQSYFKGVLGTGADVKIAVLVSPPGGINNELIYYGPDVSGFKRIRDGVISHAGSNDGYDLCIAEGTQYYVCACKWTA